MYRYFSFIRDVVNFVHKVQMNTGHNNSCLTQDVHSHRWWSIWRASRVGKHDQSQLVSLL